MTPPRHFLPALLALLGLGLLALNLPPYRESILAVTRPVGPVPVPIHETPEDAATRVLALPVEQRLTAAAAVLRDTADQPEFAVRLVRRFCDEDPAHVRDYGDVLIHALAGKGQFAAAFHFAELGGPERSEWLARALELWTGKDPAQAAEATLALAEGDGFTLVATAWAKSDPAGLADFVLRPRVGSADSIPSETALAAWLEQNPGAVNAWLDQL